MEDRDDDEGDGVRLDKWLWAARFFKTRGLAREAVEQGKVRRDGDRIKPGRELEIGMQLTIRQGWDDVEVTVRALSTRRGPAPEAQQLYEETAASRARREAAAVQRRLAPRIMAAEKPDKKQRRDLQRYKRQS